MGENRESFLSRLEPVVAPGPLMDINLAYTVSKYGHRAQVRKELDESGKPLRYFEHPRRVALILIDTVGVTDPVILCAALLHDILEDSKELSAAAIERHWGSEVAALVQVLSKIPKEGYVDRLMRYGGWSALAVKAADRLDNLRSLEVEGVSAEFRARQIKETRESYLPIFDKLLEIAPRQYRGGVTLVVDEIRAILAKVG